MAVNLTSAFIGTAINEILEELVLGTESIQAGLLRIHTQKYNDIYLPRQVHAANPIQNRVATPTTSTDWTFDEKTLSPKDMMTYGEWNPQTYENTWSQFWPLGPMVQQSVTPEVLRSLVSTISLKTQNQLERLIYQGDTSLGGADPLRFFDGFLKIMDADGTTIKPTPQGAITPASVISIMEAVVKAIPNDVFGLRFSDLRIVCSHGVARILDEAQRAQSTKGREIWETGVRFYAGIPVVGTAGMPDNRIICGVMGSMGNFHAGTWMTSDVNNLLIDRVQNNSELWFTKAVFRFGVQVGFGQETVLYKDA